MSTATPPRNGTFVQPGRVAISPAPAVMTAVVGSCVVVCLRDSVGEVGGMTHFLLPTGPYDPQSPLRYADHALPALIDEVSKQARAGAQLEAKIAGGASVLPRVSGDRIRLGAKNIEIARELVARANIEIASESVGGHHGRKVVFDVETGGMWVQDLGVDRGE